MNKEKFQALLTSNGYSGHSFDTFILLSFRYKDICGKRNKYKNVFGESYYKKGIYFFSDPDDRTILYVGETHDQSIGERLPAHFQKLNHGGLLYKHSSETENLSKIQNSNVTILYSERVSQNEVVFLQDLLIGLFQPDLNSR